LILFLSLISFLISLFIFYENGLANSITSCEFYTFISLSIYEFKIGGLFDGLSSVMLLLITFISFLVHLYSLGYMSEDPNLVGFMGNLSFFTFSMLF